MNFWHMNIQLILASECVGENFACEWVGRLWFLVVCSNVVLHFRFISKFRLTNVALFGVFAFNMLDYFGFRLVTEAAYDTVKLLSGGSKACLLLNFVVFSHTGFIFRGNGTCLVTFAGLKTAVCFISICLIMYFCSYFLQWLNLVHCYCSTSVLVVSSLWNVLLWVFSSTLWLKVISQSWHMYFLWFSFSVLLANMLSQYIQQWSARMCSCMWVGEVHKSLHFWQLNFAAHDLGSNAFLM